MTAKTFEAIASGIPDAKMLYASSVTTILEILLCAGFVAVLVRLYFRARYLLALPPQPFDPERKGMIEGMPLLGDSAAEAETAAADTIRTEITAETVADTDTKQNAQFATLEEISIISTA